MLEYFISYVVERTGTIKGKKAFQKIFYFLTCQGVPTGLNYTLYHYGPYSADLDHQTDIMQELGAIKVEKLGNRFDITSSKQTSIFAKNEYVGSYKTIIDNTLKILPIGNPLLLELLSTTHYTAAIQKEIYNKSDIDSIIYEVKLIKGDKFAEKQIIDAYKYLIKTEFILENK